MTFQGERYFGCTKTGKFQCQNDAERDGCRTTHNGPSATTEDCGDHSVASAPNASGRSLVRYVSRALRARARDDLLLRKHRPDLSARVTLLIEREIAGVERALFEDRSWRVVELTASCFPHRCRSWTASWPPSRAIQWHGLRRDRYLPATQTKQAQATSPRESAFASSLRPPFQFGTGGSPVGVGGGAAMLAGGYEGDPYQATRTWQLSRMALLAP